MDQHPNMSNPYKILGLILLAYDSWNHLTSRVCVERIARGAKESSHEVSASSPGQPASPINAVREKFFCHYKIATGSIITGN